MLDLRSNAAWWRVMIRPFPERLADGCMIPEEEWLASCFKTEVAARREDSAGLLTVELKRCTAFDGDVSIESKS